MMKKMFVIAAAALTASTVFGAVPAGSCLSKAIALSSSQSITLVNEYDTGFGEYTDNGVIWYKVKLTKGKAYTIWITGGDTPDLTLDVDVNWDLDDENAPYASFDIDSSKDGNTQYARLYADDWDEEDPSSYWYYVSVYGEIGQTAQLYFAEGIKSFVAEGEEDNPRRLTMTDAQQSNTATSLDGEFWYSVTLEKDRKYLLRTTTGTTAVPHSIMFEEADGLYYEDDPDFAATADANSSLLIFPTETATYKFCVDVKSTTDMPIKLKYKSFPQRACSLHPYVMLDESNSYSVEILPGRLVAEKAYYDGIIDESLAKIKIPEGDRWVFWTEGATKSERMVAYNTGGTSLKDLNSVGRANTLDLRMGLEVSAGTKYYVGVCDPALELTNAAPESGAVTLRACNAATLTGPDYQDEFDPLDDTWAGASLISPLPAAAEDADVVESGSVHGPHTFSAGDWYDWYKLPVRAGVTYVLRASYATSTTSDLTLGAKVYRLVDGALVKYSDWSGSLTPLNGEDGSKALALTPAEGGMYYVRVSVAEGVAHDFPQYKLHAMAYMMEEVDEGEKAFRPLGLIQGVTKGVEGSWYLSDSQTVQYPNGAALALPTNGSYKVKFAAADGYATPASVRTNTVGWVDEKSLVTVTGRYVDASDPADDAAAGYVLLSPTASAAKVKRTLWTDDAVDYFRFTAKAGYYYDFELVDTTQEGVGDAVMTIAPKNTPAEPVVDGVAKYAKKTFTPGKHYLTVHHADDTARKDSCYRLYYSCANVGTVQFSAAQINVSETAAYVDVPVTRTASDGALRVNFATVAGTALPGQEYFPTNGVLAWAAGDMSTKTIRIRLIPDLVGKYEGHERFTVKLWAMPEDAIAEDGDEYRASFGSNAAGTSGDVVTIKVKEAFAQQPGTITIAPQPLETVAGEELSVRVSRTDGSDGRVGVFFRTQNGTAVGGTDFDYVGTNLVWEAGDAAEKIVKIVTHDDEKATAVKQFNVKISALTTGAYADCLVPTIPVNKVYVSLGTDRASGTLADVQKAASAKGVTVTTTGSWYKDALGKLRTVPMNAAATAKMRFTVAGPGFFIVEPEIAGSGTISCTVGGVAPSGWSSEGGKLVAAITNAASTLVYFKFKSLSAESAMVFENQDNGQPFKWMPLASLAPVGPLDKAVVDAAATAQLQWTKPAEATSESIWYRVRTRKSTTSKAAKLADVWTNGTEKTSCAIPAVLANGATYAWVLDCAISDALDPDFSKLTWVTAPTVWHFATAAAGAPATAALSTSADVNGDAISAEKPIQLVQGVYSALYFAADGEVANGRNMTVLDGQLPPGLFVKANKGRLYGVPSQAGDYAALLQVSGAVPSTSTAYRFHVAELGTGAGSFRGTIAEDGNALTTGYPKLGQLTFSATAAGALSAKAKVGSASYAFSSTTGYDELLSRSGDDALKVRVTLENVSTVNGIVYTNTLEVTMDAGATTNLAVLCGKAGTARLVLNVPNADGLSVQPEIAYVCDLYRNQAGASAEYDALMAEFAGYYTVSLVPDASAKDGVPCGNGYLTLTVAANGTVTGAGRLADGAEVSLSSVGQLVSSAKKIELANCQLCVPLFNRASPRSFGGVLKIDWAEPEVIDGEAYGACTVDSTSCLAWNKDGPTSSFDGKGFSLELAPVGGWYNTIVNLETYYLDYDLEAEAAPVDELPASLLPAGYAYTVNTMPKGVSAWFDANAITTVSRAWAVDPETGLYDFAASVNPWKVKTSFVRATGVLTGTFQARSDDGTTQALIGTLNHYGVLLMKRGASAPLDADVLTSGFYLLPVTTNWSLSLPFNYRAIGGEDYRDWTEVEVPVGE